MKKNIQSKREREKALVSQMISLYCRKKHHTGKELCLQRVRPIRGLCQRPQR